MDTIVALATTAAEQGLLTQYQAGVTTVHQTVGALVFGCAALLRLWVGRLLVKPDPDAPPPPPEAAASAQAEAAPVDSFARYKARREKRRQRLESNMLLVTSIVPVGWLPYGMRASVDGRWPIGLACALGMLALGSASLWRSYRTTLAGATAGGKVRSGVDETRPVERKPVAVPTGELMVARQLPWIPEEVAGIALGGLRALLRAPEVKLILMSPAILLTMGAIMLNSMKEKVDFEPFGSLMVLGAILLGMFSLVQLMQNQFGLDRAGFRAYVLSPVPHLGKAAIDWSEEGPRYRDRVLDYLEKLYIPGLQADLDTVKIFTPDDFRDQLNAHQGSAFSLEPILTQSAYWRVHNRDARLGNLYFVGAGTHPGAGVPGVVASAEATAGLVFEDLGITPQTPAPAATLTT